jgi:hypothetical protein
MTAASVVCGAPTADAECAHPVSAARPRVRTEAKLETVEPRMVILLFVRRLPAFR